MPKVATTWHGPVVAHPISNHPSTTGATDLHSLLCGCQLAGWQLCGDVSCGVSGTHGAAQWLWRIRTAEEQQRQRGVQLGLAKETLAANLGPAGTAHTVQWYESTEHGQLLVGRAQAGFGEGQLTAWM